MAKPATKTQQAGKPGAKKPTTSAPAVRRENKNAVATTGSLDEMMNQDAGRGTSQDMSDNIVPLIYILQALSPQVVKGAPQYLGKEAVPGAIWPRGTKDIIDGEEGILVQPVHFSKCWIEWLPDRGGFVARHLTRPAEAVQQEDPKKPEKKIWVMPSGNTVNESREHVVLVHGVYDKPVPFVIPMSGSQHSSSRGWMRLMNKKFAPNGEIAPAYAYLYIMRTTHRTNGKDNWFGWDIVDAGEDGAEKRVDALGDDGVAAFIEARKISKQFSSGELRAADGADETDQNAGDADNGVM